MARRAKLVNSLSKGVLDPGLSERIDLTHYYSGLKTGRNVEFLPQGGFTRRAGTELTYPGRMRRRLQPIQITADMVILHNGGTPANLLDQSAATAFTTSAVAASPFVVVEIDLGIAQPVAFVDVVDFKSGAAGADRVLAVEYFDGAAWVALAGADTATLSPRRGIRTTARSRRFGQKPSFTATARNWRVVIYDGAAIGTATLGGLRFWREGPFISPARLVGWAKSGADQVQMVVTDRNIDIFDGATYLGSMATSAGGAEVRGLKFEQSLDTLFVFHEDIAPLHTVRQGAADEWQWGAAAFTNVPALSSNTAFSGQQDEIQDLSIDGLAAGDTMVLLVEDLITAPITFSNALVLPNDIKSALGGLPGITAGDLVVTLQAALPVVVRIEFRGANGGRRWPRLSLVPLGVTVAAGTTTVVQRGLPATGALMSAQTGWPRCGRLHQSRLVLGGFRAAPLTVMTSVAGNPFDFTSTGSPLTADKATIDTIDSDQVETIHDIVVAKNLLLFTESGEWWMDARTFDATQPRNYVLATRYGILPDVPLVFGEKGPIFAQSGGEHGGRTILDFVFNNVDVNYDAQILSLLAPHLITDTVDLAFRRSRATDEGNRLVVVNRDGTIAHLTLLKGQEIIAWSPWDMIEAGVRGVMAASNYDVYMLVERNGDLWLETRADDLFLDGAQRWQGGATSHFQTAGQFAVGRQLWALADGELVGPLTVDAGLAVNLPVAATSIVVGADYTVDVEPMPMRDKLNESQPFRAPARIYEAELTLDSTGQVMFAANGQPAFEVPLRRLDGAVTPMNTTGFEAPVPDTMGLTFVQRLFSGSVVLPNLEGWSKHPAWRITQTVPAPLTVKSIRLEFAMKG